MLKPFTTTVHHLPDPGIKEEIAVALDTDAGLEEGLERVALPVEAIDDFSAYRKENMSEVLNQDNRYPYQA